jgi:hypothetical protein
MTSRPDADDPDSALATRLMRTRDLADAPEHLIDRAIGLFQRPLLQGGGPGWLRQLTAILRFDSAAEPAQAMGLRSAADGGRQLLFFVEGRDIDVRIVPQETPFGRRWKLSGQVLGPDASGKAELRTGNGAASSDWDELCEFSFDHVPAGCCSLVIRTQDWEVSLPDITVPA